MDTSAPCLTCGHVNRAGARFCDNCGTRLDSQAEPEITEDRRLVTVLFCDLVGFTPLSEKLDSEEVREIQDAYFAAMSERISAYGGVVEKYAGDAVLAIFGVPVAHEDDPERAVLCALAMHEELRPLAASARLRYEVDLALRIGVNTGEVVAGERVATGRIDQAVTGDAVNMAARFQTAADPGGVMVGEETMRLARRGVRFGERQMLTLKGKSDLVPGYAALEAQERRLERWEVAERVTPLAGRTRELAVIANAGKDAQSGVGQLVAVVAEAGVGKSRLVEEAIGRIDGARIVHGRCVSYGEASSLFLVADFLRDVAGGGRDGDDYVLDRLLALLHPADRDDGRAPLGSALGIPAARDTDPELQRLALISALRRLIGAIAPAVIVLDDVHWIDEASAAVLAAVLPTVRDQSILVVASLRPDRDVPWPGFRRLDLQPLPADDALSLAQTIVRAPLAPEFANWVQDRAGGNPFFTEELLRWLDEAGFLETRQGSVYLSAGADEQLPATLAEVLLARLDRLDRPVRSVAQVASVIGRTFACRLLARVVGSSESALESHLAVLDRAQIALPRRGLELLEYIFKHAAIRDATYNTILRRRRRALHATVGRALVELAGDDVDSIAYHFARSGENVLAADWLERAGDRAAMSFANETALTDFEEARKRRPPDDVEALARLDLKLATVLRTQGRYDDALVAAERAVAGYQFVGDTENGAAGFVEIGQIHHARGTREEGIERLRPALEEMRGSTSTAGIALGTEYAFLCASASMREDATPVALRAVEAARALGNNRLLVRALLALAECLNDTQPDDLIVPLVEEAARLARIDGEPRLVEQALEREIAWRESAGELRAALESAEVALRLAERIGDPARIAQRLQDRGRLHYRLGNWHQSRADAERGTTLARSMDFSITLPYLVYARGVVAAFQGDFEIGFACFEEAIELASRLRRPGIQLYAHRFAAEAEILLGRVEEARDRLERLQGGPAWAMEWLAPAKAWARAETGDLVGAGELAVQSLAYATDTNDDVVLSDIFWTSGLIAAREGRDDDATAHFRHGLEVTRASGAVWPEARTLYYYGLAERDRGDIDAAAALLSSALTIFRRLGARPYIERAEHVLSELAPA